MKNIQAVIKTLCVAMITAFVYYSLLFLTNSVIVLLILFTLQLFISFILNSKKKFILGYGLILGSILFICLFFYLLGSVMR